ncbi:MAG: biopolymer transport protein ExbD [Nitrospinales bacterium]|jgi:biopolymer transport protein ExbD
MINIQSPKKRNIELDLIPLINIVFLLLIFFMLTSNSISSALKAELPIAETSTKIENENIVLIISVAGKIELNGKQIEHGDIQDRLKAVLDQGKTNTIEIHGDKYIEFEIFGKIIGEARKAGAEDFIFATEEQRSLQTD